MPILFQLKSKPWWRMACAFWLACCSWSAQAHFDEHKSSSASAPTWAWQGALAVRQLSASAVRLPSQGLPGYLLMGDPGERAQGLHLEHAVLGLRYRFNSAMTAQVALGAHGSDPAHVELAWLGTNTRTHSMGRSPDDWPPTQLSWGLGRRGPAWGAVVQSAGHLDVFAAMPLAKAAILGGDGVQDGAELGVTHRRGGLQWQGQLGVWSGRSFPGSRATAAFPGFHVGVQTLDGTGLSLDAFTAVLKPQARGSRTAQAPGGHSHAAPECNAQLQEVVCFDGSSHVSGLSTRWMSRSATPLTLTGAVMWRHEDGALQSLNGNAHYRGRTRGEWLQGLWAFKPQWQAGLRLEHLAAQHTLMGPGAQFVAAEAGFNAYAPLYRHTAMLAFAPAPWISLYIEAGREQAGSQHANVVALRWVAQTATR